MQGPIPKTQMTWQTWSTSQQFECLDSLIPAFLKAKEGKVTLECISEMSRLFFKKWPAVPTAEQLVTMKNVDSITQHIVQMARTRVCGTLHTRLNLADLELL